MPDDDPFADEGPLGQPLPPDDRLWRHPSELAWTPLEDPAAPPAAAGRGTRLWSVALASGVTGAVLALGIVTLVGGLDQRVTERIVERVPITDDDLGPKGVGGVPDIAAAVSPSVVRLAVARPSGAVSASGVVFRDDGAILTNAHVVDGATTVDVVLADGSTVPARVVGADHLTDVAVVVVDEAGRAAAPWTPAVLGSGADLRVGESAIAVGSPLGLGDPSVTAGVVSGLGRRVATADLVLHGLIETDAPIPDDATGGALCDEQGVVVGLTTNLASTGEGLGYAIPAEVARDIAEELLGGEGVRRAWLGVRGTDLAAAESVPGIARGGGVRVVAVDDAGPALEGGLLPGDVLVALGGVRVTSMSELVLALRDRAPGETVTVELLRGSDVLAIDVVLGER